MGSTYHNDAMAITHNNFTSNPIITKNVDEIWISPHFEHSLEYFKIRYRNNNVLLCPYIWRSDLIYSQTIQCIPNSISELNIAIIEPNISQAKNCIIPISICEKAEKYIKKTYVFSANHLSQNNFLLPFILSTDLQKNKKITVESRYNFNFIFQNYCNCVVSCVDDWDLNYTFLECFYLGIPLVHNSPMLKEYGYYYPKFDISKGAKQLENILKYHNKDEYIEKHKHLLKKYSMNNPEYIDWIKNRLLTTL